jgi:hypothetical protein
VRRGGGHRGHQRDGGGAAADDRDAPAAVVEVRRPVLRVDDAAAELRFARPRGAVPLVVAVVTAAEVEHAAGEAPLGAGVGHRQRPARLGRGPVGPQQAVAVADGRAEAMLAHGVLDVAADGFAVGQRPRTGPRAEGVAERVHVGVGAHAGVAEQVPGAPDPLAGLEQHEARAGAEPAQVHGGADARQTGTDDDDVDVVVGRGHGGGGFAHGVSFAGGTPRREYPSGYSEREIVKLPNTGLRFWVSNSSVRW